MSRARPRISDVARIAGVSTATVSRALSNPSLVTAETRAVVDAAVKETGYRLNLAARNLRHSRTGGILALVPNLANPFFSQILSGIAGVLGPAGYNLLIADTRTSDPETLLAFAEPSRADGLIILDGQLPPEMLSRLPVVEACEWVPGLQVPRVKIDNRAAAKLAVEHLISLGHCRIGHVSGPLGNVLADARLAGVQATMGDHALPFPDDWHFRGDFSLLSGRRAATEWLALPEANRPTAVFLSSDEMACGFIGEVQRHGIIVPRDLSVVGFDDIELIAHISPPLTTIRQPRADLGRIAAESLLRLISGEDAPEGDQILPVELILRESTAPLQG